MLKNKTKIYFRADADAKIGLGHVIRSLALISYLKDDYQCVFVINNPKIYILNTIQKECKNVININKENEFFDIINSSDIIVLDSYVFDEEYQRKIKNQCFKLVCIDDIGDRKFVCDAIINHSEGISEKDYTCMPNTKIYLGLKYALLRKPFLLVSVNKQKIQELHNYFVCFGGSDNENYTLNTVKQLTNIYGIKKINIVIGSEYLKDDELKIFCDSINSCEINVYKNVNAEDMVNIMLDSHIAIVPSSSISYEVLSVKRPMITGYTVDNQKLIYNSLVKKNVAIGIGKFPIKNLSKKIELIKKTKEILLKNQALIFDGKSNKRVLKIFNELRDEQ